MKKLKLYITASLDGYIAPSDGDLDWLVGYPVPSKEDHKNFVNSIDTVIMGGRTYCNMRIMDLVWPYKDKVTYVVTRNPMMEMDGVNFITENVIETIAKLKKENGKDIWLVGGAELTAMLLDNDLIDEMIITYIPEMLQKGIPLFSISPEDMGWALTDEIAYDSKAVKKTYQRVQ